MTQMMTNEAMNVEASQVAAPPENADDSGIKTAASTALGIDENRIHAVVIRRKSVDARGDLSKFNCSSISMRMGIRLLQVTIVCLTSSHSKERPGSSLLVLDRPDCGQLGV